MHDAGERGVFMVILEQGGLPSFLALFSVTRLRLASSFYAETRSPQRRAVFVQPPFLLPAFATVFSYSPLSRALLCDIDDSAVLSPTATGVPPLRPNDRQRAYRQRDRGECATRNAVPVGQSDFKCDFHYSNGGVVQRGIDASAVVRA